MIVATMIFKNDSHVLERCLRSVLPYVDAVFISDTGSTFNEVRSVTRIIAAVERDYDKKVVVEFFNWKGFAENRNVALTAAAEEFALSNDDWLFMIDADDFVTQWETPPAHSDRNGYMVTMRGENTTYPRIQLFRPDEWQYRGVLHEFPEGPPNAIVGTIGIEVASTRDGDRGRDPKRYMKDAELLLANLGTEKDLDLTPRYMFYLAQSYRDAGEDAKASEWYVNRVAMEIGYQEERYVSVLENMRLKYTHDALDDLDDLRAQMRLAQEICPHRRECVMQMMRWLTEHKAWHEVVTLGVLYPCVDDKPSGLFIEDNCYGYHQYDVLGVAAYYAGNLVLSVRASLTALQMLPDMPVDSKRLMDNMYFAVQKLP